MNYKPSVSMILILVLLSVNASHGIAAIASSQSGGTWSPPPVLQEYLATHPGDNGCISGTVVPFTIASTTCSNNEGVQTQSAYALDCSSDCQSGSYNSPSNNDYHWEAVASVPSNPSTTYHNPTTVSYWIGLQSCVNSCSGTTYLLQAGLYYGVNSTTDSKHPVLFEEFTETSGTCHSTFCGYHNVAVSVNDNIFFSINYDSGYQYWTLYSQDTTSNKYDLYYVYYGTGSTQIPVTSMAYSFAVNEGQGATSSSYFPGAFDFSDEIGLYGSHQGQLGSETDWHTTSGTAPTSNITYQTYTCPNYYPGPTCGDTYIRMS